MRAPRIRILGITYDTGFFDHGNITHEPFDLEVVADDLRVIAEQLHCDAVRLVGSSPDRLEATARLALDLGLEVWLCPWTADFTQDQLHDHLVDLAVRAEKLREHGEVVMVLGAELSLLTQGFLPGEKIHERITALMERRADIRTLPAQVNAFLGRAVRAVREVFGGKVTYASIPFEGVDWEPFDFVGVDLYRTADVADIFAESVRTLVAQGKPVVITEFGCANFKGAAALGSRVVSVIEYDEGHRPIRLNGTFERDDEEQATYLRELIEVFDSAGVDAAFVFQFANRQMTGELDVAGFGIVEVHEDRSWTPKIAFHELGEVNAKSG